jgi:diguanylate cyclase (GGDEF)-like protein/PAS domain S-box-containing protein
MGKTESGAGKRISKTILLIEVDPVAAGMVLDVLRKAADVDYEVDWVGSCAAGVERLTREEMGSVPVIGAVLTSLNLPDSHGLATIDRLLLAAPQVPILVISKPADEAVARLAVQRGAQDYLLQGHLDSYLLPKAIDSMMERAGTTEALYQEKERAQVTLNSIGDAVLSIDKSGNVTYLNAVAERLTGWTSAEAIGLRLQQVFNILDATTREMTPDPMALAMQENQTVALTPNCVLLRRDGVEAAIEDSAAPIHDRSGNVIGAVMVFRDVSEARAMALRMSYLAQHDSLTGLPNRVMFNDRLNQAVALADRQQDRITVLYLDLDRFKHTNDTLGHGIGDGLLRAVADRLRDCVRSSDTVSRQGGDEFVVLLPQIADPQHAEMIARKILVAMRAPFLVEGHTLHFTSSIGIAIYPDDGMDVDTLLKNADFAMYQAKDGGRDNFQFYKAELNVRAVARQVIESDLRSAIEHQELVLQYQPRVCLHTGAIKGVEALVRWQRPQHGLAMPAGFIPVAEETGLIVPIGRWVLLEASRQACAWDDAGLPPMRVAVNISAVELRAFDFVASVRSTLLKTGLKPDRLELELTETFLMQDEKITAATLRALRDMGVRMTLDDFGTGYSSLSYVKRLPISCLKIDRSFVRNLGSENDTEDVSIVSAVISMGRSLHKCVVAEGVETAAQLACLKKLGCPEAQGFYFSPPVAPEGITLLLAGTMPEVSRRIGNSQLDCKPRINAAPAIPGRYPDNRCRRMTD